MKSFSFGLDLRKLHFKKPELKSAPIVADGRFKLYFLIVCFIVGAAVGAISLRNGSESFLSLGGSVTDSFIKRAHAGFFSSFFSSFISLLPYYAAAFCLGLFVFGSAAVPFVLIFKGLGYGAAAGCLYLKYGFAGMAVNAILLLPSAIFGTLVLAIAYRETLGFSGLLFSGTVLSKQVILPVNFRLYCLRFLVIGGLLLLVSLLDASVTALFSGSIIIDL